MREDIYICGFDILFVTRDHHTWLKPQGLAVLFSHHQVCIKKKGGHFLGAKSESRVSAPFFASKTV